jgi:hypothetical protein
MATASPGIGRYSILWSHQQHHPHGDRLLLLGCHFITKLLCTTRVLLMSML